MNGLAVLVLRYTSPGSGIPGSAEFHVPWLQIPWTVLITTTLS